MTRKPVYFLHLEPLTAYWQYISTCQLCIFPPSYPHSSLHLPIKWSTTYFYTLILLSFLLIYIYNICWDRKRERGMEPVGWVTIYAHPQTRALEPTWCIPQARPNQLTWHVTRPSNPLWYSWSKTMRTTPWVGGRGSMEPDWGSSDKWYAHSASGSTSRAEGSQTR